jgi:hypothetical protein
MQFAVKVPLTMPARTGDTFREADLATAVGNLDRRRRAGGVQGFSAPINGRSRSAAATNRPRVVGRRLSHGTSGFQGN